eukprot:TRINITY_DN16788_c0_g1_i1.p1 TRINITY_DN16788_c0_g1~~TRINITY_DN16788_c0_g1_i1.p1  ORF type:complete len:235 (+),score=53.08 TRINITY_DN16788_c0_g1_i1:60-707(+)
MGQTALDIANRFYSEEVCAALEGKEIKIIDENLPFINIKVAVMGKGGSGKTCMCITWITGHFPGEYIPTTFEQTFCKIIVDDQQVNLEVTDTAQREEYCRLTPLYTAGSHVVILTASVVNKNDWENLRESSSYIRSITRGNIPIVLVGTKIDLRETMSDVVSFEEGNKIASDIGAVKYLECSSITKEGLNYVFVEAVKAAFAPQIEMEGKKCILS